MLDLLFYLGVWVRLLRALCYNVVADRWLDDSELDLQLNFPKDNPETWLLWRVVKFLVPKPNVHFLFLVPVEESLRRSREKKEPFPDSEATLHQRLAAYTRHVAQKHVKKMDGLATREALQTEVQRHCRITV
jgi:thymidylate kinase